MNLKKKDENPFRYCGEYYDKETEENYLRARYYQPAVGRFLTRDTYTGQSDDPESLHLYTYCYNDPVMYFDGTGNSPTLTTPIPTLKPSPAKPTPGPTPQPGPLPTWIEDTVWKFNYGEKERATIKEYCKKYANKDDAHNPDYRWFKGHDCANFVSQCLVNAGFKETIKWRYMKRPIIYFRRFDSVTPAWSNARQQFKYFKKKQYSKKVITIKTKDQIKSKTKKVKAGDLLYWDFDGDNNVSHATIITSNIKEKGKRILRYGGHTSERNNEEVEKYYGEKNILKIIRLKDKFIIPYNS